MSAPCSQQSADLHYIQLIYQSGNKVHLAACVSIDLHPIQLIRDTGNCMTSRLFVLG